MKTPKSLGETSTDLDPMIAFTVEATITFILILVIHSVCDDANRSNIVTPSVSIGLAIVANHLFAVSIHSSN